MSNYDTQQQYQPGPPPQYSQYPQGEPPKKKKTWLYILLGCGSLIIISVIGFAIAGYFAYQKASRMAKEAGLDPELMEKQPALAMAKFITATNPDLELVSVDEEKGLITVRDKKTGKTVTVNLEDARRGKIEFKEEGKEAVTIEAKGEGDSGGVEVKSEEGTVKLGSGAPANLPEWLPSYPGATIRGNYSADGKDGRSGSFSFTTNDSIDDVAAFYQRALEEAGLKIRTNLTQQSEEPSRTLVADDANKKRTAVVNAVSGKDGVTVNVTYAIKN